MARSSARSTQPGQQTHPSNTKLIVAGTDDDLWQSYLSDNSQAACDFVKNYLWNHTAQGFDVNQNPVTVQHSGLAQIWAGADAANFFGVPVNDGRYPDVFGKVQEGVVYSGPTKLAEHGGMNPGDRHVLMVVNGPGIRAPGRSSPVETTQVAPTILSLLGLDPAGSPPSSRKAPRSCRVSTHAGDDGLSDVAAGAP